MRTRVFSAAIITFIAALLFSSCGASKQRTYNADKSLNKVETQKNIKRDVETNWKAFKEKSEATFKEREIVISDLEKVFSQMGIQSINEVNNELSLIKKQNEKLKAQLAKRNKRFKEKRIKFNKFTKEKEQKFEAKFNRDMNALGTDLKKLFKNHKKINTKIK